MSGLGPARAFGLPDEPMGKAGYAAETVWLEPNRAGDLRSVLGHD